MFFKAGSMSSSVPIPFSARKPRLLLMFSRASPRTRSFTSMRLTSWPLDAKTWAIACPIRPAPTTAMCSDRAKEYLLYEAYSILVPSFQALTASEGISSIAAGFVGQTY